MLAGGRWNDRQLVPRGWIETSTASEITATDDQTYGYLWWLGCALFKRREVQWIGALGRGGQSIRIVPELDLVVVVTAGYYQDYSPRAFQVQYEVFSDVLPGDLASGLNRKRRRAALHRSTDGAKRTWWLGLVMSVIRGEAEVAF